jgi:hypothetical protein
MDTVALLTRDQVEEIRERARDGHYGINAGLIELLATQVALLMATYGREDAA